MSNQKNDFRQKQTTQLMTTQDLLFEIGTEELPPASLPQLRDALEQEFLSGLEKAGLTHGDCTAFATPRRLALFIEAVSIVQPDKEVERRGPALKAAFDADGDPTKAATGFARSCGTTVEQLERMQTDKGEWLFFKMQVKGKSATELLPQIALDALNRLLFAFPFVTFVPSW